MNKQEILEKVDQVDDLLEEAIEQLIEEYKKFGTQSEAIQYDPTINLIYRSKRILGHLLDEIE